MKFRKTLLIVTLCFGLITSMTVFAQNSMLNNALGILNQVSQLADDFNLTQKQKTQTRTILMSYLPSIASDANALMNNRKNLLQSSLASDEDLLIDIASKQGELITDLIITKEHMKKDIRNVLDDDQKDFIDALIQSIIQYRLEHHR